MRSATFARLAPLVAVSCAALTIAPGAIRAAAPRPGAAAPRDSARIVERTWVDFDRKPIPQPPEWEPNFMGTLVRRGFIEPVTHTFDIPDKLLGVAGALGAHPEREAVNVNAFDEVPNSSWFTNRNHVRAIPTSRMRRGPYPLHQPAKPWTITGAKKGGWSAGFRIKDATGKKWLVKLDPRGYPQLSTGADMVARTLLHAAGYNVPDNQLVRFRRNDLKIDPELLRGAKGETFAESDLDEVLGRGAVFSDGSYSALASLYIKGEPLGAPSVTRRRPGDSNDWYTHTHRRDLRGLWVVCSWINNWDTKDHQFLDMFVATKDSLGHVDHYLLDAGSSFGAEADGPKKVWCGYEHAVDLGWIGRRLVTLGFVEEPWRRARQETGMTAVGNFESEAFDPKNFKTAVQLPPFRALTDRDGYWGAKIVASFSDAQVAAAVDAANYEDRRARDYLVQNLIVRRDKIARYWFGRVAPLDFFSVENGVLRFHDLAVDIGLERARGYDVEVETAAGDKSRERHIQLRSAELPLAGLGKGASQLELEISVAGNRAKPARVVLTRKNAQWIVTRVRHG